MFLFFIDFCVCTWSTRFRPLQADSSAFAEVPFLPCPVDLICQHTFRIMACALPVAFHCFYSAYTLVVCFERYLFNASIILTVKAQVKFRTKFIGYFGFPPDDRLEPWLCNAHNTVFYSDHLQICQSSNSMALHYQSDQ